MAAEVGICAGCRKPIFAIQEMAWFSATGLTLHDDAACYRKFIEHRHGPALTGPADLLSLKKETTDGK